MLDRLTHHSVVVVTSGESFRMKESKARRAGGVPLKEVVAG
ncbi:MAG: ATP-binding protein [Actinomycetota bacterium]